MTNRYDRIAPHYDQYLTRLERWFLANLRRQTFARLPPNGRTLELGAGTGMNFIHYPAQTEGVATEPSTEMLKIALTKSRPDGVRLVQSYAEELPFASSSFDAAFATLVFCSVKSPAQSFAELRRVVRKGGTVVLLEHVRPDGVLGPLFDLMNMATVPLFDDHMNRRTANEASAAGLSVVEVKKFGLGIINLISCRT
jgi:ubiquinone/menaquinone biosynthesis C-methylase UbiE